MLLLLSFLLLIMALYKTILLFFSAFPFFSFFSFRFFVFFFFLVFFVTKKNRKNQAAPTEMLLFFQHRQKKRETKLFICYFSFSVFIVQTAIASQIYTQRMIYVDNTRFSFLLLFFYAVTIIFSFLFSRKKKYKYSSWGRDSLSSVAFCNFYIEKSYFSFLRSLQKTHYFLFRSYNYSNPARSGVAERRIRQFLRQSGFVLSGKIDS